MRALAILAERATCGTAQPSGRSASLTHAMGATPIPAPLIRMGSDSALNASLTQRDLTGPRQENARTPYRAGRLHLPSPVISLAARKGGVSDSPYFFLPNGGACFPPNPFFSGTFAPLSFAPITAPRLPWSA